jgi:phosphohistidine swiveling domain-containing protein
MSSHYVVDLPRGGRRRDIGYKAAHLSWLMAHHFPVPRTFVCRYTLERDLGADARGALDRLRAELTRRLDFDRDYAVRSSASLEDGQRVSFAGQFRSVLDVRGRDALLDAIQEVLASMHAPTVQAYRQRVGLEDAPLQMAVIVQEMARPMLSGVVFSAHPLLGNKEVVIEAVQGRGDALVQAGVTPWRWLYRQGQCVCDPGAVGVEPQTIDAVASGAEAIAKEYGAPVDLEWVYDGSRLWWVQLRPMTGNAVRVFSRRLASEMLPGLIRPLVWSINIPVLTRVKLNLLTELIGPNDIEPENLVRAFYHRAYFDMGTLGRAFEMLGLPPDALEIMMGATERSGRPVFRPGARTLRHLPRVWRFGWNTLRYEPRLAHELPALRSQFEDLGGMEPGEMDAGALLAAIERLGPLVQAAARMNTLIPMLLRGHLTWFGWRLRQAGGDMANLDWGDADVLAPYDPARALDALHRQFVQLDGGEQAMLRDGGWPALVESADLADFAASVMGFVSRFGHLSDAGSDFSARPWRETPDVVLNLIMHHQPLTGAVGRQTWDGMPLTAWQRRWLRPAYEGARRFRYYREAAGALYTYGYGLYRRFFLELGCRLVEQGRMDEQQDIFYLYAGEVHAALDGDGAGDLRPLIAERRAQMEAVREVRVPETIYGEVEPPLPAQVEGACRLKGMGSAGGRYSGPARVVHSAADAAKVRAGDVIIVPYSDVSMSGLFARAGAVVAESGGLLSHSSIVAREFGIPCVVSAPGACAIPDDTRVTVDGFSGEVIVHSSSDVTGGALDVDIPIEERQT